MIPRQMRPKHFKIHCYHFTCGGWNWKNRYKSWQAYKAGNKAKGDRLSRKSQRCRVTFSLEGS